MVSVIIPHYNDKELLKQCLKSVSALAPIPHPLEIIVVDNGSDDSSVKEIKKLKCKMQNEKSKFKIILNKKNQGFARAVNQGIKTMENGKWKMENGKKEESLVAVLNNDVTLDKNWLKEVLKSAKKDRKIAAVQGRNLTFDGKKIEGTGLIYFLKGKCLNRGNEETNNPKKYEKEEEVFGVSAAAALYRLSALEKVGYFDEDFFAFEEDVDLALRLKKAGFKSFYNPKAIAYHLGGATVKKMGNLRARMDAKNWMFIIIKNYSLKTIIKYFPQIFIERLRNFSGLVKQTIKAYGTLNSCYLIPLSIFLTYGEVLLKTPKMIWKRWQ